MSTPIEPNGSDSQITQKHVTGPVFGMYQERGGHTPRVGGRSAIRRGLTPKD